jgi:5-methylcytosine-specific restriction endonuclease McrA
VSDIDEKRRKNREYKRLWRQNNADREREISRKAGEKYRRAHGVSMQQRMRRNPQIEAVYVIADWLRQRGDRVVVDHIMPLALGGKHDYDNLQILSVSENSRKWAKPPTIEEQQRSRLLRMSSCWW